MSVFQFQESPTISGFQPVFGQEGDSFVMSGNWLRDVEDINFIDSYDQVTNVSNWAVYENPHAVNFTTHNEDDFNISGYVPTDLPKTEIDKFPRFKIQVKNQVDQYTRCCYEVRKDLYRIYDDVIINGDLTFMAGYDLPTLSDPSVYNDFLVRGEGGVVRSRELSSFMTGVNSALVSELALSVQMNWKEFSDEYVTTEKISTDGTATSQQGLELCSVYVEPLKSDTYLLIDVDLCVTAEHSTDVCCALFRDTEETPQKMWQVYVDHRDQLHVLRLRHIVASRAWGTRQTWTLKVGVGSPGYHNWWGQTVFVNRASGHPWSRMQKDIFGTAATSVMWIREMKHNPNYPLP